MISEKDISVLEDVTRKRNFLDWRKFIECDWKLGKERTGDWIDFSSHGLRFQELSQLLEDFHEIDERTELFKGIATVKLRDNLLHAQDIDRML